MPRALLEHSYNQTKYSRAQTLQYELVFGPKFVSAGGLNSAKKLIGRLPSPRPHVLR